MGKKTNTGLIIGGLAALAAVLLFAGKGAQGGGVLPAVFGGNGGNGYGFIPYEPVFTPGESTLNKLIKTIVETGKGFISPASPDYEGGVYPALDINEAGLFVNRATGEVYPVDPATGRQRAREENGEVVGRYIANEQGVPYGTYSYQAIPAGGIAEKISAEKAGMPEDITVVHKRTSMANVLVTSAATGITQAALTGVNPSTGASYVWYGTGGW